MQPPRTLAAGVDFYIRTFGGGRNRWGDYSGIAIDPSDDAMFWVFNQYALARGTASSFTCDGACPEDGRWGTRFGSFTFATVHDLAVTKLTTPKKVVSVASVETKAVQVQIQNRSDHNEQVEAADLGDGVTTGLVRLSVTTVDDDGEGCQPAVVALDAAKNAETFAEGAKVLKPKQQLTVHYLLTYDCTNALKKNRGDATPGDYRHVATVHHNVLDGNADGHSADDTCPHDALPGQRDQNPPPKGVKDKGCGAKKADGTLGADVLTDVVRK